LSKYPTCENCKHYTGPQKQLLRGLVSTCKEFQRGIPEKTDDFFPCEYISDADYNFEPTKLVVEPSRLTQYEKFVLENPEQYEYVLSFLKKRRTENSIYILVAYRICRIFDLPLPGWVVIHLDEIISNLLDLTINFPSKGEAPHMVYEALGLSSKGRGTAFRNFREDHIRIWAISRVKLLRKYHPKKSMLEIYNDVASDMKDNNMKIGNKFIEYSAVEKWYSSYSSTSNKLKKIRRSKTKKFSQHYRKKVS